MKNSTKILVIGIAFTLLIISRKPSKKTAPAPGRVNQLLKGKFMTQNADFIAKLHPVAKQLFINFLADIEKLGYAVIVTSGYRASAQQVALKKQNPKNATPGYSAHEYGLALDINLVKNNKIIGKNSPLKEWTDTGVIALAKKYGLRWGGTFVGYLDPVHFDLYDKYNPKTLYAAAMKKWGSVDKFKGNELPLA
jgi:hypothetical protein